MSLYYRRPGQRPAPRQPSTDLQARLNAPLGYVGTRQSPNGQTGPAQGALLRPHESAEELRMKEERLEQERTAQWKKETEAKRKAEVHLYPVLFHLSLARDSTHQRGHHLYVKEEQVRT